MNVYAFVLVLLTLAVCVVVIVHQGVENRGLRADLRRVNDRLLNALVAENAVEMNGLDKSTVTDLSPERAKEVATRFGAQAVAPDAIYDVPCDVFSPNALGAVVNDDTIRRLRTKVVAGAANNVLLREEHGDRLREMGVLYAPDYVINAGGIINVSIEVESGGYDEGRSRRKVENIYGALKTVFRIAREKGVSTNRAANVLAEERIARGRKAAPVG